MAHSIWCGEVTLKQLRQIESGTFASFIGIELTDLGPDYLAGRMQVSNHHLQPFGVLHGGASLALAETLGSVAANCVVDRRLVHCVGQSISANHVRPVKAGGFVTGVARPRLIDGLRHVWEISLQRADYEVFCISTLTMAVLQNEPTP
jgi:1,4-dihydroxy-2-naphthoyl-CoA hydrolase